MINKDFLRQVFKNDKKLLGLNEVHRICVPMFDELSVGNLWPQVKPDAAFAVYFPDKLP